MGRVTATKPAKKAPKTSAPEDAMDTSDDLITIPGSTTTTTTAAAAAAAPSPHTTDAMDTDTPTPQTDKPKFKKVKPSELLSGKQESRKVPVPPHRITPIQKDWIKIYSPLVEHMKLQVRMNLKAKAVEMRTCKQTEDAGALQKSADFVKAYCLGFEIDDAIALLRLDDLYLDTFEIKDVKTLTGDNLSRAIGRIVGKDGKTKFAIENTSRTRVVIADTKIHILGSFANIRVARDAIVSLILGSTPGKVYSQLRTVSSRMKERF
ncbi:pre-rRNA-processing protein PNO1 [Fimicolochytrium jonesii]|uniref:pre-rRNA-processing protein PNO1 n=1 Tax=Fimicolochytrium jonesii TaxID=1396493 RepID=UPI0022FF431B|nr:pre-rRNA-processing protein PNO1 [Fimicolochytrium jonesii]KAI8823773.1 pre-rRNA-processing protein PNO1 [Fimicolochytrium jonesii]